MSVRVELTANEVLGGFIQFRSLNESLEPGSLSLRCALLRKALLPTAEEIEKTLQALFKKHVVTEKVSWEGSDKQEEQIVMEQGPQGRRPMMKDREKYEEAERKILEGTNTYELPSLLLPDDFKTMHRELRDPAPGETLPKVDTYQLLPFVEGSAKIVTTPTHAEAPEHEGEPPLTIDRLQVAEGGNHRRKKQAR